MIVTSGRSGARLYRRDRTTVAVDGFDVEVADTIGAGDTFTGATIVALDERGVAHPIALDSLVDEEWQDVLRFASAAAAINCTRAGTDPNTFAWQLGVNDGLNFNGTSNRAMRNPSQGYCRAVISPKVAKFRAKWTARLKA